MQTTLNKFINTLSDNISKNPKLKQIRVDVNKKVHEEIAKIKKSINPEAVKTWHKAEKKYNDFVKKINTAQKQVDQELKKTLVSIKKSAVGVEKTLNHYKNLALKQKNKTATLGKKTKKVASKKTGTIAKTTKVAKKKITKVAAKAKTTV